MISVHKQNEHSFYLHSTMMISRRTFGQGEFHYDHAVCQRVAEAAITSEGRAYLIRERPESGTAGASDATTFYVREPPFGHKTNLAPRLTS